MMKKRIVGMMLIIVVIFTYVIGDNAVVLNAQQTQTKEYIIMLHDNMVEKIVDDYSDNIVNISSELGLQEESNLIQAELTQEQAFELERETGVLEIEENQQVTALGKEKPKVDSMNIEKWNLSMVNTPEKVKNKKNVKIAILDSGIDINERVNVKERVNLVEDDYHGAAFFEDVTSHGTSVAGVVANMNPNADIYSVKVLSSLNKADIGTVVKGIYWCIDNDIDIINMSFGMNSKSKILEHAISDAYQKGIIMVGAVGNDGQEGSVQYPAAYDEVISVGAVTHEGVIWKKTSLKGGIDVLAPGENVLTDGGFGSEYIAEGTSIAVPHVVGAISIIMQYCKPKDIKWMKEILQYSAKKVDGYNSGVLDIEYAIKTVKNEMKKIYVNNDDLYKNLGELQTFSENDFVEARWDAGGHHILTDNANLTTSFGQDELTIIKQASLMMDGQDYDGHTENWDKFSKTQKDEYRDCDIQFKRKTQLVLHGHYNYVATLDYLYKVAREVDRTSDAETIGSVCRRIGYNPGTGNDLYNTSIKNNLVKAIQFLCSKERIFTYGSIPTRHQKSLRILGMAVHLSADTFAHKTRVPANVPIQNYRDTGNNIMLSSDLKSVEDFRTKLNKKMPFDHISSCLKSRAENKNYHNYEDDAGFYSKRFNAATYAVRQVLQEYQKGSSTISADKVFKRDTATECKVAFLDKYVEEVYTKARGQACNDYKFTPADQFKDSYNAGWASLK